MAAVSSSPHRRIAALTWLNLFLLTPLFAYELRLGEGGPDRSFLFIFPLSVLSLTFLQTALGSLRALHLALLPFYLAVAVDDFVIWQYDTRLGSSMLLVFVENFGDAGEYMGAHAAEVGGALALFLATYAAALWGLGGEHWPVRPRVAIGTLALLVTLVLGVGVRFAGVGVDEHGKPYGGTNLASLDRSVPFGVLSQSWVTYAIYQDSVAAAREAQGFRFLAGREQPPEEAETYVLVIGESSRRDHWSLYGYERETTPGLDRTKNMIVFEDVVSQAALTAISVPLILTRGSIDDPKRARGERSITSALREVGFETFWLSTQTRDHYTRAINRFSGEAQHQRYFERRHDEVLVSAFDELVLRDRKPRAKRFVVLHTMGNHYTYKNRYPESYARYPSGTGSAREDVINDYDNTVAYMDHVLTRVIAELAQSGDVAALLYVSDHAENLYDDERNLFGHLVPTEYDLPVPMFVWYSDAYAEKYPERLARARENTGRPLNTRSIFYSLLSLTGTRIDDPELARLSVFSADLTPPARMVSGPAGLFDYDTYRKTSGQKRTELF